MLIYVIIKYPYSTSVVHACMHAGDVTQTHYTITAILASRTPQAITHSVRVNSLPFCLRMWVVYTTGPSAKYNPYFVGGGPGASRILGQGLPLLCLLVAFSLVVGLV